jgi:hypothetical protein
MQPLSSRLGALAKLGVAATSLWVIGAVFLVLNPQGKVEESQADIALLDFQPVSNTQRFATALHRLGHEHPRIYNMDGNEVYFSVRESNKRPDDLFHEYQDEFVNQGINERAFRRDELFSFVMPEPDTPDERVGKEYAKQLELREALLSGQMVPVMEGRDAFAFIGAITRDKAETRAQIRDALETHHAQQASRDFNDEFKGYRHIQAEWDDLHKRTLVTAAWSNEEFDIRKFLSPAEGGKLEGRPSDPDVPACPGCEPVNYFAGTDAEAAFKEQIFRTNHNAHEITSFYDRALATRGWSIDPSDAGMLKASARIPELAQARQNTRIYVKGEQRLTLTISTSPNNYNLVTLQTTN